MKRFKLIATFGIYICLLQSCAEQKPEAISPAMIGSNDSIALTQYAFIAPDNIFQGKEACQLANYGMVDTAHEVSASAYLYMQRRFYPAGPLPAGKRISYGSLKTAFGDGCGYIQFNFNPTVKDNTDITFVHSNTHAPYLSCYSVALFKRIQQIANLTDNDTLEFVKSLKQIGAIENYRAIFKVELEGHSAYYDISENPKKITP